MRDFEYFEPKSIAEATDLLARYGEEIKVIAGGTDLLVDLKLDNIKPKYIVNVKIIPGLNYIHYDPENGLRIGALTTIRALEKSAEVRQRYAVLWQAARLLGNVAIRNVATLGGNLCNAAPSADTALSLIGLSAVAKIAGSGGEREVPLEEFFIGPGKTVLSINELLVEIQVPVPPHDTRGAFIKYGIRSTSDLPIVNVAAVVNLETGDGVCQDVRIVLGNVASTPMRARKAEEIARGKKLDDGTIPACAQAAADEAHPREGSIRASAEYKKAMVKVFTEQALRAALNGASS